MPRKIVKRSSSTSTSTSTKPKKRRPKDDAPLIPDPWNPTNEENYFSFLPSSLTCDNDDEFRDILHANNDPTPSDLLVPSFCWHGINHKSKFLKNLIVLLKGGVSSDVERYECVNTEYGLRTTTKVSRHYVIGCYAGLSYDEDTISADANLIHEANIYGVRQSRKSTLLPHQKSLCRYINHCRQHRNISVKGLNIVHPADPRKTIQLIVATARTDLEPNTILNWDYYSMGSSSSPVQFKCACGSERFHPKDGKMACKASVVVTATPTSIPASLISTTTSSPSATSLPTNGSTSSTTMEPSNVLTSTPTSMVVSLLSTTTPCNETRKVLGQKPLIDPTQLMTSSTSHLVSAKPSSMLVSLLSTTTSSPSATSLSTNGSTSSSTPEPSNVLTSTPTSNLASQMSSTSATIHLTNGSGQIASTSSSTPEPSNVLTSKPSSIPASVTSSTSSSTPEHYVTLPDDSCNDISDDSDLVHDSDEEDEDAYAASIQSGSRIASADDTEQLEYELKEERKRFCPVCQKLVPRMMDRCMTNGHVTKEQKSLIPESKILNRVPKKTKKINKKTEELTVFQSKSLILVPSFPGYAPYIKRLDQAVISGTTTEAYVMMIWNVIRMSNKRRNPFTSHVLRTETTCKRGNALVLKAVLFIFNVSSSFDGHNSIFDDPKGSMNLVRRKVLCQQFLTEMLLLDASPFYSILSVLHAILATDATAESRFLIQKFIPLKEQLLRDRASLLNAKKKEQLLRKLPNVELRSPILDLTERLLVEWKPELLKQKSLTNDQIRLITVMLVLRSCSKNGQRPSTVCGLEKELLEAADAVECDNGKKIYVVINLFTNKTASVLPVVLDEEVREILLYLMGKEKAKNVYALLKLTRDNWFDSVEICLKETIQYLHKSTNTNLYHLRHNFVTVIGELDIDISMALNETKKISALLRGHSCETSHNYYTDLNKIASDDFKKMHKHTTEKMLSSCLDDQQLLLQEALRKDISKLL